jgi:SseB protein N-terminal domain/SseB protein C-terminal domain
MIPKMGTNQNDRLLSAMKAWSETKTPEARRQLYESLGEGSFLIPTSTRIPQGASPGHWGDLQNVQVFFLDTAEGAKSLAVFTHELALKRGPKAPYKFVVVGKELLAHALKIGVDAIVVDHGSPDSFSLSKYEIAKLNDGVLPEVEAGRVTESTLGPDSGVSVSAVPGALPEDFLMFLRKKLGTLDGIKAAYLFSMTVGEGDPTLSLGLELKRGQWAEKILDKTMQTLQPTLMKEEVTLRCLVLEEALLNAVTQVSGAFYRR